MKNIQQQNIEIRNDVNLEIEDIDENITKITKSIQFAMAKCIPKY